MNLATIEVPVDEARARLAEYKQALRTERNAEDEALAAAYRAAARGLPVIRLSEAIAAGGWFDNGLPRLAVVRADATQCWVNVSWQPGVGMVFTDNPDVSNRGALVAEHTVRVPVPVPRNGRLSRGRTVVPIVPPRLRPRPARLRHCHILWEVESWTPEPPKDPALLRHIRGDLWSVLACWDLTELERAVLAQRSSM